MIAQGAGPAGFGWLAVIVAVIGGGGVAGIITAIFRLRPDTNRVTVSAAEGAVIVQTGVIESLSEENKRLHKRISDLEETMRSLTEMRTRIAALETENRVLLVENEGLRERVQLLEADIAELRGPVRDSKGNLVERRDGT